MGSKIKHKNRKTINKKTITISSIVILILIIGIFFLTINFPSRDKKKIDDWNEQTLRESGPRLFSSTGTQKTASSAAGGTREAASSDMGFATGGAKDINNFRDNIENDYLPIPEDLPYEGLFYDYYFDTGQTQECEELFCPSYKKFTTEDALSNETENYMTVGLNSNLNEGDFERKKLNLVLVLDVSGSMSSGFDKYYYDKFGNKREVENLTGKTKMEIASESLAELTTHLEEDDSLGVVLFNRDSHKAKPMRLVNNTDMEAIRKHIKEIQAGGGTNMASGMNMSTEMLQDYKNKDSSEYENRIIFMTDMMPNIGERSKGGLLEMMENNSEEGIYTTFVGIGVDFNTELTDSISKVEGANSFSVHSAKQFKERMDKDFDYMVTPLVFDLNLELQSDDYKIKKVYGSTAAEESTGEIMKVNTLFPSRTEKGKTKGGVVLLQLEKLNTLEEKESDINLTVSYETRQGDKKENIRKISFSEDEAPGNSGVRKAVLLSEYADLMKNWMVYERSQLNESDVNISQEAIERAETEGIEPPIMPELGKWERQSEELQVSENYREKIKKFREHFEKETEVLDDEDLLQELEILKKLEDY